MKINSIFMKATVWNLVATTCNKFYVFFVSFFSLYELGAKDHGALSVFIFLVTVMSGVLSQTITVAANRSYSVDMADTKDKALSGVWSLVVFSFVMYFFILLFVVADVEGAIKFLTGNAVGKAELYMLLCMIPLNILTGAISGALQGKQKFSSLGVVNFSAIVISVPVGVYLISTAGVTGAVEAILLHAILNGVLHLWAFGKAGEIRSVSLMQDAGEAVGHVYIPLLVASLLVTPVYWFSTKMLSLTPDGLVQASLFSLMWQLGMILTHVVISLGGVIMPRLTSSDIPVEDNLINYMPAMLAAFFFILPISLLSSYWIGIVLPVYNEQEVKSCLLLVMGAVYISAFKSGMARIIAVKGKGWISIISNSIWLVIFIALIKFHGIDSASGLALIIFVSHVSGMLVFMPVFYSQRILTRGILLSKDLNFINFLVLVAFVFSIWPVGDIANLFVMIALFAVLVPRFLNSKVM